MLLYWIWFAQLANISNREKQLLLERYSDPQYIYGLDEKILTGDNLPQNVITALADKDLSQAEKIVNVCRRKDIGILCLRDSNYPRCLRNIADPPMVLYYKGTIPDFDAQPVVAVVGTRKATAYGMSAARKIANEMALGGALVVSGCAAGIDKAAMEGAIDANKPVVGVLGCGIDVIYPKTNRRLYMRTEEIGCLFSEYPPGTRPYRWNFPQRNRIISGLSNGVVVAEAPVKSGALITAECALEQGRDVFVIPGNIGVAACAGSNALLREGATVVCSGWDVLQEYELRYPHIVGKPENQEETEGKVAQSPVIPENIQTQGNKKSIDNPAATSYSKASETDLPPEEKTIFDHLGTTPILVDDLIAETGIPTAKVLTALTMLTMRGLIVNHPGRRVSRKRNSMSGGNGA